LLLALFLQYFRRFALSIIGMVELPLRFSLFFASPQSLLAQTLSALVSLFALLPFAHRLRRLPSRCPLHHSTSAMLFVSLRFAIRRAR